ncbi:hypothetical protein NCC78_08145 [Micromonospora phytophila]|nr:hypothetical protein [Micromonospora phytophila]MCM0674657.1 hypothetical protein [Micromonospora phytophila]
MDLVPPGQSGEAVQLGRRSEHRMGQRTQRQHSGPDPTAARRRFDVDEVDGPREWPPSTDRDQVVDVVPAEPGVKRLRPGHQTVLNSCNPAEHVCTIHEESR